VLRQLQAERAEHVKTSHEGAMIRADLTAVREREARLVAMVGELREMLGDAYDAIDGHYTLAACDQCVAVLDEIRAALARTAPTAKGETP
jgi:hypothetical protein